MTTRILVLGNGTSAQAIVNQLIAQKNEVIWATHDKNIDYPIESDHIETLTDTQLSACRVTIGAFGLTLTGTDGACERTVDGIVVAEECGRSANFDDYGLAPSASVRSLSEVNRMLAAQDTWAGVRQVVFLTGLKMEGTPIIFSEIMDTCRRLQMEQGIRCYVLTRHVKVAASGLEGIYRQTKENGVVYFKFSDDAPKIDGTPDSGYTVTFTDEITGDGCRLQPDLLVVDETVVPSASFEDYSRLLKIERNPDGFLQADNVHRLTVGTNRKGVWAAGPARLHLTPVDVDQEAANVAVMIRSITTESPLDASYKAVIDNRCTQCLTCYRVCPFRAIVIKPSGKLAVMPDACERCGICTAECPQHAITLKRLTSEDVYMSVTGGSTGGQPFTPHLVVIGCARSAGQAAKSALAMNLALPKGLQLVEVPCAGIIGLEYLLTVFRAQADGVMVLTCHEGNCYSERGNQIAQAKLAETTELIQAVGLERERLQLHTLAANMNYEFVSYINAFERQIMQLGPSKLRK